MVRKIGSTQKTKTTQKIEQSETKGPRSKFKAPAKIENLLRRKFPNGDSQKHDDERNAYRKELEKMEYYDFLLLYKEQQREEQQSINWTFWNGLTRWSLLDAFLLIEAVKPASAEGIAVLIQAGMWPQGSPHPVNPNEILTDDARKKAARIVQHNAWLNDDAKAEKIEIVAGSDGIDKIDRQAFLEWAGSKKINIPEQLQRPSVKVAAKELSNEERNNYLKAIAALAILVFEGKQKKFAAKRKISANEIANDLGKLGAHIDSALKASGDEGLKRSGISSTKIRNDISKGLVLLLPEDLI
jgi:hypothetical protein